MKRVGKVIITLVIMVSVFGSAQVLADAKGCSLQGKKYVSSESLFNNGKRMYRFSANNGTTSPYNVEAQLKGGPTSVNVFTLMKKYTLTPRQTKSTDLDASAYNYARVTLYGNSASDQKTGCIASGLVSNQ